MLKALKKAEDQESKESTASFYNNRVESSYNILHNTSKLNSETFHPAFIQKLVDICDSNLPNKEEEFVRVALMYCSDKNRCI